jgi:protease PrsW
MHSPVAVPRWTWLFILIFGGLLFLGAEQALKYTGNPNFFPTVVLLGSLVVPVAFVSYFYREEQMLDPRVHVESPLVQVALCFIIGGAVGVIVAGVLEYATLTKLSITGLLTVSLIEEAVKLIFPVAIFMRGKFRSEIDGLLFGTASGMGFAALETMGYGLVAFIQSLGNVGSVQEVLLVRGLVSPVGHAAWTALICAALWRKRQLTGRSFSLSVIWIYVLAVMLHFFWNLSGSFNSVLITFTGYICLGVLSLILLIRRLREARRAVFPAKENIFDSPNSQK